ncbi:NAD(P)/FAD-dependent oxidoreductase [Micromonospora sp. NPDC050495]|uniref:NAD(P)/FAD-dependent oxidoreductase n=1 Tax=Micromonospora sp. NPDC050495 TaxID=3154936 RepID=UPI0033C74D10
MILLSSRVDICPRTLPGRRPRGRGPAADAQTRATGIDSTARQVTVTTADGGQQRLDYDRLIIGTGAEPVRPPIAGLDRLGPADGVHVLHTFGDTRALTTILNRSPRSALIVGAGYVGLEMAEAFRARGLRVTVVEQQQQVLPTVDEDLARLVADELNRHNVEVHTGVAASTIDRTAEDQLHVTGRPTADPDGPRFTTTVDLVLVVGVRPDTSLARIARVDLGVRGAIAVDRHIVVCAQTGSSSAETSYTSAPRYCPRHDDLSSPTHQPPQRRPMSHTWRLGAANCWPRPRVIGTPHVEACKARPGRRYRPDQPVGLPAPRARRMQLLSRPRLSWSAAALLLSAGRSLCGGVGGLLERLAQTPDRWYARSTRRVVTVEPARHRRPVVGFGEWVPTVDEDAG